MIHNQNACEFNKNLIKIGILTLCFAVVANFIPAIYMWLVHGVVPSGKEILTIWGLAAATYGISWIVQPIAYFSILGTSGTYVAWLSGSVADIRLPSVAMAQKVAKVEAGTHEGDVISTLGIAASVFTSVTIITLFTFIGSKVLPLLPQFVTDSFSYILPALFGAVYMEMAKRNIGAGTLAIIFGLLLTLFAAKIVPPWALTIIIVLSGVLSTRIIYVLDKRKQS